MSNYKHPIRDPNVGSIIDERYYLQTLIGRGATSSVYEATDAKTERSVAVKLMHSHLVSEEMFVSRFAQESKTAKLLQHPNIVRVEDYNVSENGVPFLVMELVKGSSLSDVIKGAGWLPTARAFSIFQQVCAALAAAHEKSIVHRDLKPSNIMLTTTDGGDLLVKVLDFGIAKQISMDGDTAAMRLTQAGEALGSLLYMSPEQCLDEDIDSRSDCYSMGCVMYETLTGKPPLCARTAFETMNKQISEMPEELNRVRPDLSWPEGLQDVVFKALAKKPSDRYQKIQHLQDDLRKISEGRPPAEVRLGGPALAVTEKMSDENGIRTNDSKGLPESYNKHTNQTSLQTRLPEPLSTPDRILSPISDSEDLELSAPWSMSDNVIRQLNFAVSSQNELHGFGSFFLVSVLILLSVTIWQNLGPNSLPFALLLMIAFAGTLVLTYNAEKAMRTSRKSLGNNIAVIKTQLPKVISVTKLKPITVTHESYFKLWMTYSFPESSNQETTSSIQPIACTSMLWGSLCTASQLDLVSQKSQTFPMKAFLFYDASEKPVAVQIADQIAWVEQNV